MNPRTFFHCFDIQRYYVNEREKLRHKKRYIIYIDNFQFIHVEIIYVIAFNQKLTRVASYELHCSFEFNLPWFVVYSSFFGTICFVPSALFAFAVWFFPLNFFLSFNLFLTFIVFYFL